MPHRRGVSHIISLLPLFRDQAHSVATIIKHMEKIQDTEAFLKPGHALAKQINGGGLSMWSSGL